MKFNTEELLELTTESGGRFSVISLEAAQEFCKKIATSHYENFPVGSILIPKKFRNDFFSVYAFSRVADDIADELASQGQLRQLHALNRFEKLLADMSVSKVQEGNPIFIALKHTREIRKIPIEPFQNLLTAFKQDVRFQQPVTMHDNISYCQYSANPIGELVLRIFGLWNTKTAPLSNSICTGLQLANFWQDISRDKHNGRIYIPQRILSDYEFDLKDNLVNGRNNTNFTNVLKIAQSNRIFCSWI
ncbi:MAG: squalene/phytoene synthase family protein [Ignavibacteria bacterium]|nr:squalene/phytoene synthase family protein [Ignavibacteria bacterium]